MSGDWFAGYPAPPADEAVGPDGRLRSGYAVLEPVLDRGADDVAGALAAEHAARGVTVGTWRDGRQTVRPIALDPMPRIVTAAEWARIAAGVEQRHRALNAFLADAYRAAGRRRGDSDRAPEIVQAGALPEWAVTANPAREPDAVGLAWPGQPRATVAATDLVRTGSGEWLAMNDELQVPAGLGYALAARRSARAAAPDLVDGVPGLVDPADAIGLLRAGLASAAPPACSEPRRIAVLSGGDGDGSRFEHRLLAEALDVPMLRPADLWPRLDGGLEATVGRTRVAVDVLYRRFGDGMLRAHRTPAGQPLDRMLSEAVRAGRLGLANVPGNGIADDAATAPWVAAMVRFYLGEEPLLGSPPTWVLADPAQYAEVRDRLQELVLTPVTGYGGGRPVRGPDCSAAELAELRAEVAAAPHRFVARTPVEAATLPTLVDGTLQPRCTGLRVFSVAGPEPRVLPAPLTTVLSEDGWPGASPLPGVVTKDTWLLT